MTAKRIDPDLGASEPEAPKPIAYSPKALAALFQIGPGETLSERTVVDWCNNKTIPGAYRIGRRWFIPAASVELLLNGPLPDNISVFRK